MSQRQRNIGPGQRRRRLVLGVVMLVVGAGALAALVAFEVDRVWRLALLAPFWASALGFFQAKEET